MTPAAAAALASLPEPGLAELLARGHRQASLGADEAAKRAYLDALKCDPASLEALLELARLALRSGHRSAALTCWRQAIFCHPAEPAAHVNLGGLLLESGAFAAARAAFADALALAPDLAVAHQGMARALTGLGDAPAADAHWRRGLAHGWLAPQPYRGAGMPVRVLMLVSARGGNIPTRALIDDTLFAVTALYAEGHDAARPLPEHAVVFNAIGDADLCAGALAKAAEVTARSAAPVINAPPAVAATTRAAAATRLAGIPGLVVPEVRALARAELATAPLSFPRLVRAPGFHTGQHFVRVERAEDLATAIADLPGEELLAIEPLDARGPDGLFRKYRVMFIGGALLPLHLAVSPDWKVHYFSAAMAESAAARAEEAAFLADMPGVLGAKAMAALGEIAGRLGLDYGGVDFGLSPSGDVLLFEANAGMVIQPPGPEPIWDHRRAPIARALGAVKALLLEQAGAGPPGGVPIHGWAPPAAVPGRNWPASAPA
ncbi:MAG TPA: tetratricopeptide repeat protein [Caulobacteraceae bacterium]|nr:tetratricopeptide repeat protein [Caulobacteraceae bacterium]